MDRQPPDEQKTEQDNQNNQPTAARKSMWRWLRYGLICIVLLELFARFGLGLGHPPLMMNDPDVEYRYKPNQDLYRFHNHVKFNQWSMRSDDFPESKQSPDELRVLVIGDSIINGGMRLDQSELATELLREQLRVPANRKLIVGNVSAGSWGPPNLLAYIDKFSLFNADIVVFVVNSEDATDILGHSKPVGTRADMPEHDPPFALWEAHNRYLRRYLPTWLGGYEKKKKPTVSEPKASIESEATDPDTEKREEVRAAIAGIASSCKEANVRKLIAIKHLTRREMSGTSDPGHEQIIDMLTAAELQPISMEAVLKKAIESGIDPYLDNTHFNAAGQVVLANVIAEAVQPVIDDMDE